MTFGATRTFDASAHDVATVLANVDAVGTWNPAIEPTRLLGRPAVAGDTCPGRILGVVPCHLVVVELDDRHLRYRLHALGSTEEGTWSWSAVHAAGRAAERTRVSHSFRHEGLLARVMTGAFASVAAWRVDRLGAEAGRPTP